MSDKEYGVLAEEIGSVIDDTVTIDLSDISAVGSTMSSTIYQYPTYSAGTTAGFNGTSGAYLTSGGTGSTVWTTNNTSPWSITSTSSNPSTMKVQGDAEFEGDVKINGVSIAKALNDIQKRLAILVPDPEKLEHFAALKKAYEHYKTLEALCQMPKKDEE